MVALIPRLLHMIDMDGIGIIGRVVQILHRPVGHRHTVDDGRGGGDQIEIIFAGQPLLDDLEVEEAEEAAAKAEAEGRAGLHLEGEAGVVEPAAARCFRAASRSPRRRPGTGRKNTTDCTSLKPGSAFSAPPFTVVIVSPTAVSATSLICAVIKPISPAAEFGQRGDLGFHAADAVDQMLRSLLHEA